VAVRISRVLATFQVTINHIIGEEKMDEIAIVNLTEKDLPPPNAENWGVIDQFALSFDGYNYWGSLKKCAEISNNSAQTYREKGILPSSLTDLRTCLFFEQRRWRHFGEHPDKDTMTYIHALVEAIRIKVRNGEVD
jgi:hypothetical protein